jgi:hypothetical protein
MGWKKERDALIAQTLAFVQSVARKKDAAEESANKADAEPEIGAALLDAFNILELPKIVAPPKSVESPKSIQMLPANAASDFRTEIQNRVANFRAHQERFHRERAEYFSATLAKMHAAIGDDSAPLR